MFGCLLCAGLGPCAATAVYRPPHRLPLLLSAAIRHPPAHRQAPDGPSSTDYGPSGTEYPGPAYRPLEIRLLYRWQRRRIVRHCSLRHAPVTLQSRSCYASVTLLTRSCHVAVTPLPLPCIVSSSLLQYQSLYSPLPLPASFLLTAPVSVSQPTGIYHYRSLYRYRRAGIGRPSRNVGARRYLGPRGLRLDRHTRKDLHRPGGRRPMAAISDCRPTRWVSRRGGGGCQGDAAEGGLLGLEGRFVGAC